MSNCAADLLAARADAKKGGVTLRFVLGPIPDSQVLDAATEGWNKLREPRSGTLVVILTAITLVLSIPVILLLHEMRGILRAEPLMFTVLIIFVVLVIPVHELAHAVVYPGSLRSSRLVVGFWPKRFLPYVVYDYPLPKRRVLWMLMTPLIALSVIPAVLLPLFGGPWIRFVSALLLTHVLACSGDIFYVALIASQVPKGGYIHNKGWSTRWTTIEPATNLADCDGTWSAT